MALAPPRPGMRVLDVGCGTGAHLARYASAGSVVAGIDRSRPMLRRAAARLGGRVVEGDALRLPVGDRSFDLVVVSMVLHELTPHDGAAVLDGARRAIREGGCLLVIDYFPEPPEGLRGRLARRLATTIERVAGGEHYRNFLAFTASGGVPALAGGLGARIVDHSPAAAGTIGAYLIG